MGRAVITADDVPRAGGDFVVPAGAIVTPLARDVARDRGVTLIEGQPQRRAGSASGSSQPAADDLEARVRALVTGLLASGTAGQSGPSGAGGRPAPVKLVKGGDVRLEPFPFPGPGPDQQVQAADVVTADDGPMAAGYLTLTAGSFPWTLTYDEVQIVLEGELHIGTADGTKVGLPGDVLYVPKGSQITFGTPSWARFVYVTFPADWAG
ncbi:ethanolamine utilization protein EutQ [Kineosphaera limosa]|uniref:Ethanolamine utilisation EutQ n=1 Tax=Kineosphaera limosa NBRC 100340 TaxID=1184609 RepID=K6WF30_9MICO|nr:cupin domain-containing protein [Kineosphaera limosa]NYD99801.1 ethanolamine utilization protein EutQ [Kineosphaera limosa]GAB97885.1 ethanolamine utilisation EutQ [Kineosphaera limosa NBRC 100340]